jgi:hypothetical protein
MKAKAQITEFAKKEILTLRPFDIHLNFGC